MRSKLYLNKSIELFFLGLSGVVNALLMSTEER